MVRKAACTTSIIIFIITALVVGVQTAGAQDLVKKVKSGRVSPIGNPTVDLGLVDIDGGPVDSVFELINGDSRDLVLKGAFTSCACTTAWIELADGSASKSFGMSIPTDWYGVVKPGEKFKIHVRLDPAFHGKDGTGAFRRDIYLISSAPPDDYITHRLPMIRNGSVSLFRLKGEVVNNGEINVSPPPRTSGPEKVGNFRIGATVVDIGVVKQSSPIVTARLPFIYEGDMPVRITGTPTSCACTRARVSKADLDPGEKGILTIEFDPNYHKEPDGRFFKDIIIQTEPAQAEEVSVRLWAQIETDLGENAYRNKEHDEEEEHAEETEGHP
jgi:hypothetical protein